MITGTDVQTACVSYDWIDGKTYSANNNTATFNIVDGAVSGCDSLVTLDLTMRTVDFNVSVIDEIISSNATGASYRWLDCNNNYDVISGETAQIYSAVENGDYAVEVIQNGCTDTSECITISAVVVIENTSINNVSVFPNPNKGMVNFEIGSLKEVTIKVFDLSGQLIYQKENICASIHQFNLNKAPGFYFIEVSSGAVKQEFKLIMK